MNVKDDVMRFVGVLISAFIGIGAVDAFATIDARLVGTNGQEIGKVEFRETASGVVWLVATVSGLPPGLHGFHIHETGLCEVADGFESAGGHLTGGMDHGVLYKGGPHPGDLPNFYVQNDGKMQVEVFLSEASGSGNWFEESGIFDADGSAIVIHSKPDDYMSQPSGNAGERIACGVIEKR